MPNHNSHLAIIIPVYNEGMVIRDVIDSIPRKLVGIGKITILAVNDGSTDNSAEEINKTRAVLIEHPWNMGAGSATITGLEAAKMLDCDIAVTFDGDGQHCPDDIARVIKPIVQDNIDFVIGTRLKNHKGMPWTRKIGNVGLSTITMFLSGRWTSDSQSGFKGFSKKAIDKIKLETTGYEFCSEIIIEASKHKLKTKEIPIKVIYNHYSKKKGQSILNGVNIVFRLIFKKITG
jgi:glycosyltransferase involved in cell wall biosynthesis